MLDLVLRAGDQLDGDSRVVVGVARAGRGAGERVGPNDWTVDLDEQFRGGADQPVDRVPVAGTERRPQAPKHGVHVDRSIRRDDDRAGDHRLDEFARPGGVARRCDRGKVMVDGDTGLDDVARGRHVVSWFADEVERRDESAESVIGVGLVDTDDRDRRWMLVRLPDGELRERQPRPVRRVGTE